VDEEIDKKEQLPETERIHNSCNILRVDIDYMSDEYSKPDNLEAFTEDVKDKIGIKIDTILEMLSKESLGIKCICVNSTHTLSSILETLITN